MILPKNLSNRPERIFFKMDLHRGSEVNQRKLRKKVILTLEEVQLQPSFFSRFCLYFCTLVFCCRSRFIVCVPRKDALQKYPSDNHLKMSVKLKLNM